VKHLREIQELANFEAKGHNYQQAPVWTAVDFAAAKSTLITLGAYVT